MSDNVRPHCGTCRYWWIPDLRPDGTQPESQCVIRAPAPQPWSWAEPSITRPMGGGMLTVTNDPMWRWSVWPPTPHNAFCGEWQPRPPNWPKPDEWLVETLRREKAHLEEMLSAAQRELQGAKAKLAEIPDAQPTEAHSPDGEATTGGPGP